MRRCRNIGFLRKKLGNELFRHSVGVARMAALLARAHGEDENLAYLAGLWHDCAKPLSAERLRKKAVEFSLRTDGVTRHSPHLLHAPVGAVMAAQKAGIEDERVLRAIEFHTTGKPGLGRFEQIIYLADAVEINRVYPGVRRLRKMAFHDLDGALLEAVDNAIKKVIERGYLLHPFSAAFRNELLLKRKND
ncbi:MAG: HD domain-containing protein [Firmicutes bacterium]|jgi:predicted HD superfamily hydrolase involved in NAD metabolism|nr:HD domain-containing protein [Bacillota bacterium]